MRNSLKTTFFAFIVLGIAAPADAQDAQLDCAFDKTAEADRTELLAKLMDGSLGTVAEEGDAESRMYDAVRLCAKEAGRTGEKEYAFFDLTQARILASASRAELVREQFPIGELEKSWNVTWPSGAPDPATFTDDQWSEMEAWVRATNNPEDALEIAGQVSTYLMLHRAGASAYETLSE